MLRVYPNKYSRSGYKNYVPVITYCIMPHNGKLNCYCGWVRLLLLYPLYKFLSSTIYVSECVIEFKRVQYQSYTSAFELKKVSLIICKV